MGGDMANVKNSNLKVPPLKIVLSSATSGASDRSSSTSPSSESESLDSNLTIISDNQHDRSNACKSDQKEETAQSKQERVSRHAAKGFNIDKSSSSAAPTSNKRSYDNNGSEMSNSDQASGREQTSSSNQRITRSSQRAAQLNKADNINETNGDETNAPEAQDKTVESARKVKRRKGEPQENEHDSNQQVPPPPPVMATICPADYELPLQNSFELYRDIRKRPYKKLLKLTNVQPKVPHGFRDYLLNGGPYLLDGNRIGAGIKGGSSLEHPALLNVNNSRMPGQILPKIKSAYTHSRSNQRKRVDYDIPKLHEAPTNLKQGSPLYELFQDQEKSRHKMRMQHLKERERCILTAEQEILRAYNKAATVDSKQELNLSACTYLYLQERYHYIDENNDNIDSLNPKDSNATQTSADRDRTQNVEANQTSSNDNGSQENNATKTSFNSTDGVRESIEKSDKQPVVDDEEKSGTSEAKPSHKKRKRASECQNDDDQTNVTNSKESSGDQHTTNGKKCDTSANIVIKTDADQSVKKEIVVEAQNNGSESQGGAEETSDKDGKAADSKSQSVQISDADQLVLNKSAFLDSLQEIDEKWAKIKEQMLIRHKNEADSLFAVQSLDWEWKAKEIGECDVRVALRIEPKLVPRVEVSALDY